MISKYSSNKSAESLIACI